MLPTKLADDTMSKIGRTLGLGKQAEVYEFGDLALKLYKSGVPKTSAFREAAHLAFVERNGLPAPRVHAVKEYEGRWAVVMDLAPNESLGEGLISSARAPILQKMVLIHQEIHTRPGTGLAPLKARLAVNIRQACALPEGDRKRLLQYLQTLPDGDTLCHGDFHPWNVHGSVVVDWLDACSGHPAADVCRTYILLRQIDLALATDYVEAYVSTGSIEADQVFAWLPPVAAARLAEDVPLEQMDLLQLAGVTESGSF
ncbi:phosphotransferase family protein [Rhizobium grahamii]|uniref:Phosphotransferase n=1 Tax=Rhizobium grahamii CCGE 502 TaxID=990285 RepID=S3HKB3_9HYPH|nr:aminoglycoside phosphotransferase family protein [Rhizobium grahamii]EPE98510.1 phosphotransferase [Rhizobium grahamii CCGE 502]